MPFGPFVSAFALSKQDVFPPGLSSMLQSEGEVCQVRLYGCDYVDDTYGGGSLLSRTDKVLWYVMIY